MVRVLECLGIMVFVGLAGAAFRQLLQPLTLDALCFSLFALPLAYFAADLLSGLIHWVCDSFGCGATPIWGPLLVAPFRRHHHSPLQITQISLAENLGSSAIAGSLVLGFTLPPPAGSLAGTQAFFWHLWLWFIVFGVVSNLFHRWSHLPAAHKPHWMQVLQRWGLILNSQEHLRHHQRPYRINYCILCGWANALTNRVPWSRLESALALLGIKTNFD